MSLWNEEKQATVCECGCGTVIDSWNSFVSGHNSRVMIRTEEHCRHISEAQKGIPKSEETCRHMSEASAGIPKSDWNIESSRLGRIQYWKDHPEELESLSKSIQENFNNHPEIGEKISEANLGHIVTEDTRQQISKALKGRNFSEEHCKNISEAQLEANRRDLGLSIRNSERQIGKSQSPEQAAYSGKCWKELFDSNPDISRKLSEAQKRLWNDPRHCEMMAEACHRSPNKTESELLQYLNEDFPDLFEFWGDGRKGSIEGKLPDFVCKSKKLIVEVFGRHWHSPEGERKRIDFFKSRGWECYVLWADSDIDVAIDYSQVKNWVNSKVNGALV